MAYDPAVLRPGDVLLMTALSTEPIWDRVLDAAIAWSTGGPYVHAALVGEGHLIEQIDPVIQSPLAKYTANGNAFSVEGLTPAMAHATIAWAMAHLGQPYGITALLEDGGWYDAHLGCLLNARPRYVTCSGFVAMAFAQGAGIPLTQQPLPSPMSLAFSPRLLGPRPWDPLPHHLNTPPTGE